MMLQEIFESHLEKRTKNTLVPINGKKMIVFVDDMNMPAKVRGNVRYKFNLVEYSQIKIDNIHVGYLWISTYT
jgi:hypothetical protein